MNKKISRKEFLKSAAATLAALPFVGTKGLLPSGQAAPLGNNAITLENNKPGTADWQLVNPATSGEIEGYASKTSVGRGESISFFVSTEDNQYTLEIFRLGWYGGWGGRRLTNPVRLIRARQPMPVADANGLIECNWKSPYTITIPNSNDATDWCSGYYVAKLTTKRTGKDCYIGFVVRDDNRPSAYLFQSSVTTHQAYNNWGGKSLYDFNSTGGRAFKVSFNRPYAGGWGTGYTVDTWAGWEIKFIRFLEREGYDVTYCTNVDTHANANLLLSHRGFLSVGHDEYWSLAMRNNVENAVANRVSLGFFDANTCYWQIRFENSLVNNAPNRTVVCYKYDYVRDPMYSAVATRPLTTTLWRDPILNRPEDALIGVMYDYYPVNGDIVVENTTHWAYAGTGLQDGDHLVGLLGYEADRIFGNAPASLVRLAHSPLPTNSGTGYSDMTVYTHASGATVFAAGTIWWAFALDDYLAGISHPNLVNPAAQQITRNVLARFVA